MRRCRQRVGKRGHNLVKGADLFWNSGVERSKRSRTLKDASSARAARKDTDPAKQGKAAHIAIVDSGRGGSTSAYQRLAFSIRARRADLLRSAIVPIQATGATPLLERAPRTCQPVR